MLTLFLIGKQHFSDITLKRTVVTVCTICCEIKIFLFTTSPQHTHTHTHTHTHICCLCAFHVFAE